MDGEVELGAKLDFPQADDVFAPFATHIDSSLAFTFDY